MQAGEVWGVQQGEGAHLDGLWNCLVDERLVESGRDTPAKGSLVAHVVVSFATAGRTPGSAHVLPFPEDTLPLQLLIPSCGYHWGLLGSGSLPLRQLLGEVI